MSVIALYLYFRVMLYLHIWTFYAYAVCLQMEFPIPSLIHFAKLLDSQKKLRVQVDGGMCEVLGMLCCIVFDSISIHLLYVMHDVYI